MKNWFSLLFAALLSVSMSNPLQAQCSIKSTATSLSTQSVVNSPRGFVYNPIQSVYYVLRTNGIYLYNSSFVYQSYYSISGINSIWWNSNTNTLEGNAYSSGGYRTFAVNATTGAVTGSTQAVSGYNQPYASAPGAYNSANNQVIFKNSSTFYRYNRANGNSAGTTTLSSNGTNTANWIGYTGCSGKELVAYDASNRRVHFWNISTGTWQGYSQLPTSAPTSIYFFTYFDDKAYIGTYNQIYSYEVLNQGLQTNTLTGPFCDNSSVNITFATNSASFNTGNIFTAQLSDQNGGWSAPVNIGTVTSTTAQTIVGTIPNNTTYGTGYRIRVVASNPITIGGDNGVNMNINVPNVNLGPNASSCPGDTVTLTAPVGPFSYSWSSGASSQIWSTTSPGTYSVTVSNSVCSDSDTITISALSTPSLSLTDTVSQCDTIMTLAGPSGFSSYAWSNGGSAIITSVQNAGNYHLTVTDGNGCSASDSTFANLIDATIEAEQTSLCAGDSVELATAGSCIKTLSISNSTLNVVNITSYGDDRGGMAVSQNYIWNISDSYTQRWNKDLTGTPTTWSTKYDGLFSDVSTQELYTLKSNSCTVFSASSTCYGSVSAIQKLNENLGVISTVNLSQTLSLNYNSALYPGSGFLIIYDNAGTFYHIELSSGTVTTLATGVYYNKNASENWASWGVAQCASNGSYEIIYAYSTGFYSINLDTPSTVNTVAGSMTNNGHAIGSIAVDHTTNRFYFQHEYSYTNWGSYSENLGYGPATFNYSGTGNSTYAWSIGATTSAIKVSPSSTTTYTVSVSFGSQTCTDTETITLLPAPTWTLQDSLQVCGATATITGPTGLASYDWSNGDTVANATFLSSEMYYLTATDNNGCEKTDSVDVTVLNPTIAPGDTTICSADSIELTTQAGCVFVNSMDMTVSYASIGSDDNTGIAVTPNYVYVPQDNYVYRMDHSLGSQSLINVRLWSLFSDLNSGTLYSLMSTNYNNYFGWTSADYNSINRLLVHNESLTVIDTITLSSTINLGYSSGMYAGSGFIILWSNQLDTFYKVDLPSGQVTNIGSANMSAYIYNAEGFANYGVAQCNQSGGYTILFRSTGGSNNGFGEYNISTNQFSMLQTFTGSSPDLARITVSPWTGKWFGAHEYGYTGWGLSSENVISGDVDLSGFNPFASYLWSTTDTTESIIVNPSTTTNYSLTLTEGTLSCADTMTVTVIPSPNVSVSQTDVLCSGSNTGAIALTSSGGTTPYSYAWSDSITTASSRSGLTGGDYVYSVTGGNNCVVTDTVTLDQPDPIVVSDSILSDATCFNSTDGGALLTVTGGTSPYTYAWSNGGTAATNNTLSGGYQLVTVTDSNNCVHIDSALIPSPNEISDVGNVTSTGTFVCPGSPSTLLASAGQLNAPQSFTANSNNQWTYSTSSLIFSINTSTVSNAQVVGTPTLTVYYYGDLEASNEYLSVYDENNNLLVQTTNPAYCSANYTSQNVPVTAAQVTQWMQDGNISLTTTPTNFVTSCSPDYRAYFTLTFDYALENTYWFNSSNFDTALALGVGASVTVNPTTTTTYYATNMVAGCNGPVDSITIIAAPKPATTYTQTPTSICAGDTSSISASGAISYTWPTGTLSGSGTTAQAWPSSTSSYVVTVGDVFGCSHDDTITVNVNPTPVANILSITPPTCSTSNDGNAAVFGTGGQAPYQYNWSNGVNSAIIFGIGVGTYTVTITDANGCTTSLPVVVPNANNFAFNATVTDLSCNGNASGAIAVSPSGGTTPLSYAWSTGSTSSTGLSGLSAGSYALTITDNSGCTYDTTFAVAQPAALTATVTNVLSQSCSTTNNGSITVNPGGGTAPYTYAWNNGSSGNPLSAVAAGNYTVTITDANNCTVITNGTVPFVNSNLNASVTNSTDLSCFNANDGSITTATTGGDSPYNYSWNTGASSNNLNGLPAGTYTLLVTDDRGCTSSTQVALTQPAVLNNTLTSTDPSCNGVADGQVALASTGGTAPYSYLWTGGLTGSSNNSLAAGTYTITISDLNGCADTQSVQLTEPTAIDLSALTTADVSCFGLADGTAQMTVAGGSSPYSFLWSDNSTASSRSALDTGMYSVTVTDANSCTADTSFMIAQPSQLQASIASSTNISCFGGSNGSITTSVSGGSSPYTYAWNNSSSSANLNNLGAGSYIVTVTDANGCTTSTSVGLTQPSTALVLTVDSTTNNLCNGNMNGAVYTSVSGGGQPYNFSWSNNATTEDISGLMAGSYTLTVTDNFGCVVSTSANITEPTALQVSLSATDISCFGAGDGEMTAAVSGGTSAYSYLWSNGDTTATTDTLQAGSYGLTVTDANGCTANASGTIAEPNALTVIESRTAVLCNGQANGNAGILASGGTGAYTYAWGNGASTPLIAALTAGTYSYTVSDANGCSVSDTIEVTEPQVLANSFTNVIDIACNGGSSGSATASLTGGTAPYNYAWSNGASTVTIGSLSAGSYTVTVSDVNSCSLIDTVTINQSASLIVLVDTAIAPSCTGLSDGSVYVTVLGGSGNYNYNWSNGSTADSIVNVASGDYYLTVTDGASCTVEDTVTLQNPTPLSLTFTSSDVLCFGDTSGTAQAIAAGGTGTFIYAWSNGAATDSIQNLAANTYDLTVTDGNGCSITGSQIVGQPAAALSSSVIGNINTLCFGDSTGTVVLATQGGTAPYNYTWSMNTVNDTLNNQLSAGNQWAITSDANGCIDTTNFVMASPTQVQVVIDSVSTLICVGDTTGYASLNGAGGVGNYSYNWPNGSADSIQNTLLAGNYLVTLTDGNGCIDTATISVAEPTPIALNDTISHLLCFGDTNGAIVTGASGANMPFDYAWSTGDTTTGISNLSAGLYTLSITNAIGCVESFDVTVNTPSALNPQLTSISEPVCFFDSTGTVGVNPQGGVGPYSISWNTGDTNAFITQIPGGFYEVTLVDANGCIAVNDTNLGSLQAFIPLGLPLDTLSCIDPIVLSVDSNNYPSVQWSTGSSDYSISVAATSTITIQAFDTNACQVNQSITATVVGDLGLDLGMDDTLSCDNTGSELAANMSFDSYDWSTSATDSSITVFADGDYSLTVSDTNGCLDTDTINVRLQAAPIVDLGVDSTYCEGDFSLDLDAGAGMAAYNWNDGSNNQMLTITQGGQFWVEVEDQNGCLGSDTITITLDPCLSIGEVKVLTAIKAYPNPTRDFVTLEVTEGAFAETALIQVIDFAGTVHLQREWNTEVQGNKTQLDLNNFAVGQYFILFTVDGNVQQFPIQVY